MSLPGILADITEAIERAASRRPDWAPHDIAQAAVNELGHRYAGSRVYFPAASAAGRESRDNLIHQARKRGTPVGAIAGAHGLSRRRVEQILADKNREGAK